MAGFFAISIGVMILIMALLIQLLKIKKNKMIEDNVKWNPDKEMKSRGIVIGTHEVCEFSFNKKRGFPESKFSTLINVYK
jgi:hypothetical protein